MYVQSLLIACLASFALLFPAACSGASSDEGAASREVTTEYLTGRWVENESQCSSDYPTAEYSADGEVVIDTDREPYEIRGNEVHYLNPVDGGRAFDVAKPIDEDTMALTFLNMEPIIVKRCAN